MNNASVYIVAAIGAIGLVLAALIERGNRSTARIEVSVNGKLSTALTEIERLHGIITQQATIINQYITRNNKDSNAK